MILVCRFFWNRAAKLREELKSGGAILGQPRRFMIGVALPAVASFASRLGIVAVFLAGFSIPVAFHTVMAITRANSISSSLSFTPGGVGLTQALNVVVPESTTSASNATAYSVAQQLIVSAWDVVFAVGLVAWVFGWSGGKQLIRQSYADAGQCAGSSGNSARRDGRLEDAAGGSRAEYLRAVGWVGETGHQSGGAGARAARVLRRASGMRERRWEADGAAGQEILTPATAIVTAVLLVRSRFVLPGLLVVGLGRRDSALQPHQQPRRSAAPPADICLTHSHVYEKQDLKQDQDSEHDRAGARGVGLPPGGAGERFAVAGKEHFSRIRSSLLCAL